MRRDTIIEFFPLTDALWGLKSVSHRCSSSGCQGESRKHRIAASFHTKNRDEEREVDKWMESESERQTEIDI